MKRRDLDTAIVSYTRASDGARAVRVGQGDSLAARVADADAQLPPGVWTRDAVSTPTSVLADVSERRERAPLRFTPYERKVVQR